MRRKKVFLGGTVLLIGASLLIFGYVLFWSASSEAEEDPPSAMSALGEQRGSSAAPVAGTSRPAYEIAVERDVLVTMRDGTRISADVYRPRAEGRFPVLYAASPYQKDLAYLPAEPSFRWRETGPIEWYVERGYVYVLADVRGTGGSEGTWRFFDRKEQHDLYDTIEWAAARPWSNGKVGMIGESYYAAEQWLAAAQNPPHLAAIAPFDGFVDFYRDANYHGGIANSGFLTRWHYLVRAAHLTDRPGPINPESMEQDLVNEVLSHPTYDEWWDERSAAPRLDEIRVPTYSIGTYESGSLHLRGNLLGYEQLRAPKKLMTVPGDGQEVFRSPEFHERVLLPWYDHWLKGVDNGIMDEPPVDLFVQGRDEYRYEQEWPLERAEYTPYYLRPGPSGAVGSLNDGGLSTARPPAVADPTTINYPDPEWEVGTATFTEEGIPDPVGRILTFTSEPLEEDTEVTGPIKLVLYASSDQPDTDFVVRLSDQEPDNVAQEFVQRRLVGEVPPEAETVTRGWLKASHRALDAEQSTEGRPFHTHEDPEPLEPGEVYGVEIEVWPTSHVFEKGHRIRVELAPGDSLLADEGDTHHYGLKMGTDTFYTDAEHPSHILLPIVPNR